MASLNVVFLRSIAAVLLEASTSQADLLQRIVAADESEANGFRTHNELGKRDCDADFVDLVRAIKPREPEKTKYR